MPDGTSKRDWRSRFDAKKTPKTVVLHTDFAGIKTGTTMFVGTPGLVANYIDRIPAGETRTISRLRNEMARKAGAEAMCPVSTAIFLRIVSEAALADLEEGKAAQETIPFWRVIDPDSKIASKLKCDSAYIAHLREMEAAR